MSWPIGVLGEICDVRDGTHDSPKYQSEGYPLITSKNLVNGSLDFSTANLITEKDHLQISKRSKVDNGDILYAMIGTVGNPVIVDADIEFSIKNVGLIKFKESSQVYNRYLIHALSCDFVNKQILRESKGGTQKFVSLKVLRNLEIPLPPLPVQKKIAAALEKADTLRGQCQQMEQELNKLAQSVFLDMFGDPVTNPNSFKINKLSELVFEGDRVNYGVVQPGEDYKDGAPLIRISDLVNEKVDLSNLKYINPEIDGKHKKSKLRGNEVLIACVGATIGKLALASKENKGMNIARAVVRVSPNNKITPYYLLNYLKSSAAQRHFIKETRAVGQPTLNVGLIASCPILIPPKDLQIRFQSVCEKIGDEVKRTKILQIEHELTFNSLMQRAFKGELELKDVA